MDRKPRVLVTISYSFSIRYLYRTGLLQMMRTFCEPVIIITWQQPDLIEELQQENFEVHIIEEPARSAAYIDIRRKIDFWFDHFRLRGKYKKNQQNYLDQYLSFKAKLLRNSRKWYNIVKFYNPAYRNNVFKEERRLLQQDEHYQAIKQKVISLHADALFTVTPFHRQEDILLRACEDAGLIMITSILSFDNITKRGWIPVNYHTYIVWNKENKAQLLKIYSHVKHAQVHIAGAPQFDFYFDKKNLLQPEEWKELVGLKGEQKKIILYAGGPQALFPLEPEYVKTIADAIDDGRIKNAVILFRCHPIDKIERWKTALANAAHVVFDASWTGDKNLGYANITEPDIKKLCSTLAYTDVHINLCSTMTVDGSAYNKPQIGPAYLHTKIASHLLEQMYWQEHFVPVMQTGGLMLARSADELVQHVNNALQNPSVYTEKNHAVLESIITFTDGRSTDRVASFIQQALVA